MISRGCLNLRKEGCSFRTTDIVHKITSITVIFILVCKSISRFHVIIYMYLHLCFSCIYLDELKTESFGHYIEFLFSFQYDLPLMAIFPFWYFVRRVFGGSLTSNSLTKIIMIFCSRWLCVLDDYMSVDF